MHENNYLKYIKFLGKVSRKLKPRFSFHYVAYTTLFFLVIFSVLQLVSAATPNPGHPWSQVGDGVFIFTNGATDPLDPKTYTFPNAHAAVLTTNDEVTVAQGGTGLSTIPIGSILAANTADTLSAVTFSASGTKILTNIDGAISWANPVSGMTWPALAGIPNYTGSSSWGTSYTTTGSGTVLALQTSPAFTTPSLGVATATSVDFGTTILLGSRALTVDTGGVFNVDISSDSGDDFTIDTNKLVVEGDTGNVGIGDTSPDGTLDIDSSITSGVNFGITNTGVYTGTGLFNVTADKATTGTLGLMTSTTLSSGTILSLVSDGRKAEDNQKGLNITLSNINPGTARTYGAYISNLHSGDDSTNIGIYATASNAGGANYSAIFDAGNVGIGTTTPTARLQLAAGTATSRTAPLKFTSGTNLTAAEEGAMEWDGTNLFITQTTGPTRKTLAYTTDITPSNWDTIGDPSGNGAIAMGSTVQTMDWGTATTQNALSVTGGALTTGKLLFLSSNTLTSGTLLDLSSGGTGALTNQKGLNIALSGTNGTSAQTTYSTYLSNTHAGSGTNVGLYTTASGGTNNLGLNVDAGQTLIGGTTLTTENATQTLAKLNIVSTMSSNGSDSAIAGIHGYHTFTNGGNANYTQVGNRFYFENTPTTNSNTMVGEIIRVKDSSGLANLVRGIDVNTSDDGSNTLGTNTGIRAKGRTFGIQGITNASAGGVSVPAAIYGESTGTTQGDVLRLFSNSMTSAPSFATFYHNTSTFTGVGLKMDFAAGSGTFSGDYLEFKNGGNPRFKVTNAGIVSMGLSATASTTAVCSSLANTATPAGGTTYEIRDCSGAPAADYAEMYPVEKEIEYGDIVAIGDELINTYDTTEGEIDWNKVKGKVTKLIKSTDPYQKNVIGIASDNYGDFSSTGYNIKDEDNPMPVALNGRVPVKISENSEPIKVGDYLTTSSQPGKATKATESGQVIGKALEPWNPSSGKKTVMLFIEQGYQNSESLADSFNIDIDSVSQDGILVSQKILEELINNDISTDDYVSEVLTDRLVAGLEIITPNVVTNNLSAQGEVNFNGLTYFNESVDFAESVTFKNQTLFEVPPLFNSDTAGFAVVKEGAREVRVSFDNPYMTTPVVTTSITFEKNTESGDSDFEEGMFFDQDIKSVVKDKDETGFTIVLNKKASQDINFSWIALAVKDAKIYESVIEGLVFTDTTDTTDTTINTTDTTIGDTIIEEDIIIEETTEDIIEDTVIEEEIIIEDVVSQETSTGDTTTEIITEEVSESIPETELTSSTEINI